MVSSPCVSICEVEQGRCIGCGRTQTEIAEWRDYDEPQRLAIMDRLEQEAAAGGWSIDASASASPTPASPAKASAIATPAGAKSGAATMSDPHA